MLLQCEFCQAKKAEMMKIPCGFYFELTSLGQPVFVMPTNGDGYRNICLDCLYEQKE